MIRKGRYFVPSMNNYESKDDVLILVTDFGMGRKEVTEEWLNSAYIGGK